MNVVVNLPDALRGQANGRIRIELHSTGGTVGDVLAALKREVPGVHSSIVTERGEVRQHVNVFVGSESIRWTGGLATPVEEGSEVHIIPAVSGG